MPEYINPWPHTVELIGPAGERIRLKSKSRKQLDAYYDRYADRGYIERVGDAAPASPEIVTQKTNHSINIPVNHLRLGVKPRIQQTTTSRTARAQRTTPINAPQSAQPQAQQILPLAPVTKSRQYEKPVTEVLPTAKGIRRQAVVPDDRPQLRPSIAGVTTKRDKTKQIVGRVISGDALQIHQDNSAKAPYRISNGVGIGVLSYNRGASLNRFVESVKRTSDLNRSTLFISDDASTDQYTLNVLAQLEKDPRIVVIRNTQNIGISGNSNRLLRCLSRFEHMFICNDDVEFTQPGWAEFYIRGALASGFHHFCYRQPKIYNAKIGEEKTFKNIRMNYVNDKPHGAMLYMSNQCFKTIGYFDPQYKFYGMEHVDWSMRPAEFNLQPPGFYDLVGSTDYVKIYPEATSVENKTQFYNQNRAKFEKREAKKYVHPCPESEVPKISYVIPCRDIDRSSSIKSVVMGVIGQSFPEIEIWLVEQDLSQKIDRATMPSINHLFADGKGRALFNKSLAFNAAVHKCTTDSVILHDADMLSRVDYTKRSYDLLQTHESIHICGRVIYLNMESTNRVNQCGYVPGDVQFERIVGYFEGGSLAARISTYWHLGGFNEDYWGYGCEDCDFYTRISSASSWLCDTEFDLIHLWHGRAEGWNDHHKQNKQIEEQLGRMSAYQRVRLQHEQLFALGYGSHLA